jgi:hypothetical protein
MCYLSTNSVWQLKHLSNHVTSLSNPQAKNACAKWCVYGARFNYFKPKCCFTMCLCLLCCAVLCSRQSAQCRITPSILTPRQFPYPPYAPKKITSDYLVRPVGSPSSTPEAVLLLLMCLGSHNFENNGALCSTGWSKRFFLHLMFTIKKVTSNVQTVPRQSPTFIDARPTLTSSVIPISNYVIMVSD